MNCKWCGAEFKYNGSFAPVFMCGSANGVEGGFANMDLQTDKCRLNVAEKEIAAKDGRVQHLKDLNGRLLDQLLAREEEIDRLRDVVEKLQNDVTEQKGLFEEQYRINVAMCKVLQSGREWWLVERPNCPASYAFSSKEKLERYAEDWAINVTPIHCRQVMPFNMAQFEFLLDHPDASMSMEDLEKNLQHGFEAATNWDWAKPDGTVSDGKQWDRTLTPEEVKAEYDAGLKFGEQRTIPIPESVKMITYFWRQDEGCEWQFTVMRPLYGRTFYLNCGMVCHLAMWDRELNEKELKYVETCGNSNVSPRATGVDSPMNSWYRLGCDDGPYEPISRPAVDVMSIHVPAEAMSMSYLHKDNDEWVFHYSLVGEEKFFTFKRGTIRHLCFFNRPMSDAQRMDLENMCRVDMPRVPRTADDMPCYPIELISWDLLVQFNGKPSSRGWKSTKKGWTFCESDKEVLDIKDESVFDDPSYTEIDGLTITFRFIDPLPAKDYGNGWFTIDVTQEGGEL